MPKPLIADETLADFDSKSPAKQAQILSRRSEEERATITSAYKTWKERPTMLEARIRGGVEGATMGFSGELEGFGNATGLPKPLHAPAALFAPWLASGAA